MAGSQQNSLADDLVLGISVVIYVDKISNQYQISNQLPILEQDGPLLTSFADLLRIIQST